MIPEFEKLSDNETMLLLKAPILVSILIAGADGKIDKKEIKEAMAISQKQQKSGKVLSAYFEIMAEDFEDKLRITLQGFPPDIEKRNELIIEELTQLNAIWLKLGPTFSNAFYEMLKLLAKGIASSSGGVFGLNTIGDEEAKYLGLPMINDPSR